MDTASMPVAREQAPPEPPSHDFVSMERRKMVNTDIAMPKRPCVTFSGAAADCDGHQQPVKRQAMTTEQAQAMSNVKKVRLG